MCPACICYLIPNTMHVEFATACFFALKSVFQNWHSHYSVQFCLRSCLPEKSL